MNTNYMRVMDCPSNGELHDWIHETIKGEWDSWGKGTMKQKRCLKCKSINFLEFTDEEGKNTNIESLRNKKTTNGTYTAELEDCSGNTLTTAGIKKT